MAVMTIAEFLAREIDKQIVGSNAEKYHQKFIEISESSGVEDKSVDDREVRELISRHKTFAFTPMLFNIYWAIYRGLKIGWKVWFIQFAFGIASLFLILSTTGDIDSYNFLDWIRFFLLFVFFVFFAMHNFGLVFKKTLSEYEKYGESFRKTTKLGEAFVALALDISVPILIFVGATI